MRGRTNTMTTTASKASVSTSKRIAGGKARTNSGATRTSSGATSVFLAPNPSVSIYRRPIKQITEVDGIDQMKIEFIQIIFFFSYRYEY